MSEPDRPGTENIAAACAQTAQVIEADLGTARDHGAMRLLMLTVFVNRIAAHMLTGGHVSADEISRAEAAVEAAVSDQVPVRPRD